MTRLEVLFKNEILFSFLNRQAVDDKYDFGRGKLVTGEILSLAIDIVGGISKLTADKQSAEMLKGIGLNLAQQFSAYLTDGWEPGDAICPPFPPRPRPYWETIFNPDTMTSASKQTSSFNQIQYAYILKSLVGIPQLKAVSKKLDEAGELIVKKAAGKVYDEYCGTHPPIPHFPGVKERLHSTSKN
jgi:hypothetical protein